MTLKKHHGGQHTHHIRHPAAPCSLSPESCHGTSSSLTLWPPCQGSATSPPLDGQAERGQGRCAYTFGTHCIQHGAPLSTTLDLPHITIYTSSMVHLCPPHWIFHTSPSTHPAWCTSVHHTGSSTHHHLHIQHGAPLSTTPSGLPELDLEPLEGKEFVNSKLVFVEEKLGVEAVVLCRLAMGQFDSIK